MLAIAKPGSWTAEIHTWVGDGATNRNKFIFSEQSHNLPYTFVDPFTPTSDWTAIGAILTWLTNSYWQNTDYRSCLEIRESGKAIQSDWSSITYQIIDKDTWNLKDEACIFN
jgi:hypothetical protein